ncbi:MAG: gamma-glutamylcyclotransferase family protein [Pseudomonadota bacterium]
MFESHLFVYGTLRQGGANPMHDFLARESDFIAHATWQGRLYRVDFYPGAVPSDDPAEVVHGEVYRLRRPLFALAELDRYEACGPGFALPTEYVRELRQVRLHNGHTIAAWVYVYNRPVEGLELIPGGDFFAAR